MLEFTVMRTSRTIFVLAIGLILSSFIAFPAKASSTINLEETQNFVGQIQGVGNIWTGLLPTRIAYPVDSLISTLSFPIQGLLPIDTLRDSLTGVDVTFEIWSDAGKKIGNAHIFSSDWNPAGPNTLVSMYIYGDGAIGTQTLIIRTQYNLRSNGLVTTYLKQETKQPIQIVVAKSAQNITFSSIKDHSISDGTFNIYNSDVQSSYYTLPVSVSSLTPNVCTINQLVVTLLTVGTCQLQASQGGNDVYNPASMVTNTFQVLPPPPSAPGSISGFQGSNGSDSLNFTFQAPISNPMVSGYQVQISRLYSTTADPTATINYVGSRILKTVDTEPFSVSFDEVKSYLQSQVTDISNVTVLIQARAVNSYGVGNLSGGTYFPPTTFNFAPPLPSAKKVTITCIKGKLTRKISALKPNCPTGFSRK